MTYHPWRELRALDGVVVTWSDLPGDLRGFTDGVGAIHLDRSLNRVERRCTLTHELLHRHYGHRQGCRGLDEALVVQETARKLITLDALARAAAWSRSVHELADELWVTEDVLNVRLAHLHPAERALLTRATAHHRETN